MSPSIAIVSAGEMGAAIAARLTKAGCSVYTTLAGRSASTKKRASEAGMQDATLSELSTHAEWVLSILPPSNAYAFAESFLGARQSDTALKTRVFIDCNAVSPSTVKRIDQLFRDTGIAFIDAGIIGGPPKDLYVPTIYASSSEKDVALLQEFVDFQKYGLKVTSLRTSDDSGGGVGDASALKMSYAGITKGISGLMTTMVLSANAASPATSRALLQELSESQPIILRRLGNSVPSMIPKAYRWIGEMEEIADFVDSGAAQASNVSSQEQTHQIGDIYRGMAALYRRVEGSLEKDGREAGDISTLLKFSTDAKAKLDQAEQQK